MSKRRGRKLNDALNIAAGPRRQGISLPSEHDLDDSDTDTTTRRGTTPRRRGQRERQAKLPRNGQRRGSASPNTGTRAGIRATNRHSTSCTRKENARPSRRRTTPDHRGRQPRTLDARKSWTRSWTRETGADTRPADRWRARKTDMDSWRRSTTPTYPRRLTRWRFDVATRRRTRLAGCGRRGHRLKRVVTDGNRSGTHGRIRPIMPNHPRRRRVDGAHAAGRLLHPGQPREQGTAPGQGLRDPQRRRADRQADTA